MFSLNFLKEVYYRSPLWIKKIYSSIPFEIRSGKEYRKWIEFLKLNLDHEEYELFKIKETVTYSYLNVNYYKRIFTELGMVPEDIKDKKDLSSLPLLDKQMIRENPEDFMVRNYPAFRRFYVTTGGTSGIQHTFFQSKNVWKKEQAFIINYYMGFDYNYRDLRATLRGGEFSNLPENVFWKINPINNEINFSPFHINSKTITYYVDKLNELKPMYIHGYPSALTLLMKNIQEHNLKLHYSPKAVFLASENYTHEQTEGLKSFFNGKITTYYGHSERLIFAPSDCELMTFSVDRRYGAFELVGDNNEVLTEEGKVGEIVGTGFDNYAMPLIRYRTNDLTSYSSFKELKINPIKGRWNQEFLDGSNMMRVSLTGLNMHSDIFKNVLAMQFYQPRIGEAVLVVVAKKSFTDLDARKILQAFNKKAGHAIKFSLELRDSLIQTERGKTRRIIKDYQKTIVDPN
ncbi:MAG: phenylacetate--CoA ligase family protein [Ignavibacteria bacterium]|jgi:phenylacetate-CoA ligase|nr:phenylacetate--CoA ligase family protein [Ignavibacteria bacterium]MCU7504427.1 phenylacetate--CoA ligase family protein [Ignavibacteria bacterium]MCU7517482.1 phenylacetate--CoA ligase family protein [Ignavibacteria bacterium]